MSTSFAQFAYWRGYRQGYYDALCAVLKDNGGDKRKKPILHQLLLGDVSNKQVRQISALINTCRIDRERGKS